MKSIDRKVPRFYTEVADDGLTKQEFKEQSDINNIVANFMKTGEISHVSNAAPHYGDFTYVTENHYHEALTTITAAQARFADLPAKIRDRFGNDPVQLIRFMNDKKNLKEAQELGLAAPDPEPTSAPNPAPAPQSTPPKAD